MISCVKVLSDMDIAEKRKPLDGSFMGRLSGRTLDFRVATAPSVHGETMAIRILDRDAGLIRLEKLGLLPDHIAAGAQDHPVPARHAHRQRPDRRRKEHHALRDALGN